MCACTSSSRKRNSPESAEARRIETRSSFGAARRSSTRPTRYVTYAAQASPAAASLGSSSRSAPSALIMVSDHSPRRSRSSIGSPSSSAMTIKGSGLAMSSTKSHSPRAATRSISSRATSRMCSNIALMRDGVKPRLTSRRWRACSGSSIETMERSPAPPPLGLMPWALENTSGRRSIAEMSSYLDTTQSWLRSSQCTGSFTRNHSKVSWATPRT